MLSFDHLGRALRWLRDGRGQRQYEVAEAAGITKAMLSAYETGRQKPSLETLEKLLQAMDSDLHQLHETLQLFETGRPQRGGPAMPAPSPPISDEGWKHRPYPARTASATTFSLVAEGGVEMDIRSLLGLHGPLAPEQEEALRQILDGFHRLLRYLVAQRLG